VGQKLLGPSYFFISLVLGPPLEALIDAIEKGGTRKQHRFFFVMTVQLRTKQFSFGPKGNFERRRRKASEVWDTG
jgi:hypothetical protein